jgi:3-oxoacyl-[acyl-carrier-protein] synthase III
VTYSVITGWGMAVPEKVMTNADFERIVDTSDEWIMTRTGIRERRIANAEETPALFATRAAQQALDCAGIQPTDLDLIIVATVTGDYTFPATANLVQHALGANCPSFDIQAACTGWIYGMVTAHQFISSGAMRHVLVIGAETLSKITDFSDRSTCVLFGDGAGATVLSASNEEAGILGWSLGSDGTQPERLYRPAGGSRIPITAENAGTSPTYIQMMGSEVFKFATRIMGTAMEEALADAGLTSHDLDLLIPHQANLRIIEAATKRLELPSEKVFVNLERYGNTSAAAIPIALCEAIANGRVTPGMLLGVVAFGGGLTWGAIALKWTTPVA